MLAVLSCIIQLTATWKHKFGVHASSALRHVKRNASYCQCHSAVYCTLLLHNADSLSCKFCTEWLRCKTICRTSECRPCKQTEWRESFWRCAALHNLILVLWMLLQWLNMLNGQHGEHTIYYISMHASDVIRIRFVLKPWYSSMCACFAYPLCSAAS